MSHCAIALARVCTAWIRYAAKTCARQSLHHARGELPLACVTASEPGKPSTRTVPCASGVHTSLYQYQYLYRKLVHILFSSSNLYTEHFVILLYYEQYLMQLYSFFTISIKGSRQLIMCSVVQHKSLLLVQVLNQLHQSYKSFFKIQCRPDLNVAPPIHLANAQSKELIEYSSISTELRAHVNVRNSKLVYKYSQEQIRIACIVTVWEGTVPT